MAIYHRIRDLREDHNWTQQQIADFLHVARTSYGAYENGISEFTPDLLCRLAVLYGTSVDYLLGLTDERRPYLRKRTHELSANFNLKQAENEYSVSG